MYKLEKKIKLIVSKKLNINPNIIKKNSFFIEELGADSLDIIELVMALEEEFNIEITDEESKNIKNIKDIINYIKKYNE
ncbi:Acyl carrier protein [Candidatus Portiera aleyrodidarum]|uniref:Acyl carrier protein n=1 Tax=Candidatus Portiera aleyrodidarum TaxID=91844 RepID=A0A8D9NAQ9_9GAMM|nr:acyl carrier protein [Candidatus Portiera aleyrodidarum]CEI58590.1 Acyl carrier protein [Candidatus Portiera aleyrodidarum]CEL12299.1 Acyl carrier protein [Candidatus Portiera aleyrodidarum]